jgi:NitT/TauT family transport system permease protein
MTRLTTWLVQTALPPLVLFALVLLAWQGIVTWFEIKPFLLPGPLGVAATIRDSAGRLTQALLFTGAAALCGFGLSLLVGTLVAFAFSQSRILRTSWYPYAIFLQTVPVVAVAPLIVLWLGYGFQSVVVVAFILSLFPIITNATAGLLTIDPDLVDLFRLNNASRWQVLWKLRFPNAVPAICVGAKTSSGLAVVGAIVGEFFAGYGTKQFGLGYLIRAATDGFQSDALFAAVLMSTLLGIAIFGVVTLTGAAILARWYDGPVEHRR